MVLAASYQCVCVSGCTASELPSPCSAGDDLLRSHLVFGVPTAFLPELQQLQQ
jgi:hypothetical protein